jgi:hypothetical protein
MQFNSQQYYSIPLLFNWHNFDRNGAKDNLEICLTPAPYYLIIGTPAKIHIKAGISGLKDLANENPLTGWK